MPNYSSLLKIDTKSIVDGAITTDKLADSAVTTSKLADSAVTAEKISNKSVSADKLNLDFLIYECSDYNPLNCGGSISFSDLPAGHWIGFIYFAEGADSNTAAQTMTISTDLESKSRQYRPYSNQSTMEQYSFVWYFDIELQDGNITIDPGYDQTGIWSMLLIRISSLSQQ